MRKALNDNPMVQIGVLGLLAVVVGFFLITQMGKGSSTSSTSSTAASVAHGGLRDALRLERHSDDAPGLDGRHRRR